MKLSVIVPCFNERATVLTLLDRVARVDLSKEIVVVDDGSSDGTVELLNDARERYPEMTLLRHEENRGKGAAIRTGLQHATGDVVIIQDADLEYDPEDYHLIVAPMVDGRAPVVYGSRNLRRNGRSSLMFYWGGRLLTVITNLLYGSRLTDEATCYKAFLRPVIQGITIESDGFEFCPEVTAKLLRHGYTILEVPITYHPRGGKEGKKIKARDGAIAIWTLIKYRLRKIPELSAGRVSPVQPTGAPQG